MYHCSRILPTILPLLERKNDVLSSVKSKSNQKTLTLFDISVFYNNILVLTVNYLGCEMVLGHYAPPPPPLKSARMKLQRHLRGQIRGSWVCPVHLDYCQLADKCISHVFTWF